jgi:hypothetical protein
MNDRDSDRPLEDDLFDRIVDGELSAEELRIAVRALEREPDGWRRCATAFLEAQCLRASLRTLGRPERDGASSQSDPLNVGGGVRSSPYRWLRFVAAAGIVAASFAIGWIAHGTRSGAPTQDSLAVVPGNPQPQANELTIAESHALPHEALLEDLAGSQNDRDAEAPERSRPAFTTVAHVRLGIGNAPAEVPILAGPAITEEWLARQPPPVSEHGQVVLERNGYQVDQRRQFLTAILPDGRRVAVPVDHVQIQYTGSEPL